MKIRTYGISTLLVLLLATFSAQAQDNSFRGFTLGTHVDSIPDIMKRGKTQKLSRYEPKDGPGEFQGDPLKSLRLFFHRKRLHSIEIKIVGEHANKVLAWMEAMYGEGKKDDAMGYKFIWEGSDYRIFWEQNLVTKDAMMTYLDDRLHDKYLKYMYELQYGTE